MRWIEIYQVDSTVNPFNPLNNWGYNVYDKCYVALKWRANHIFALWEQ